MSARCSSRPPSSRPRTSPSAIPPISIPRLWGQGEGARCSVAVRPAARWPGLAGAAAGVADGRSAAVVGRRPPSAARVLGDQRDGPRLAPCGRDRRTPSTQCVCTNASTILRVELDAGELAQLPERLLGRQRRHPVGPGGGHRLERVRHVQDPRQQRDLVADQAVRVARAVVPLVVVADDRQLAREPRDRRDDLARPAPGASSSIIRSSLLSRSCLSSTASGTPILPTSWSRPPHSRASRSASPSRITRPMSPAISLTRHECLPVNGIALVHRRPRARVMVWVNISRISV